MNEEFLSKKRALELYDDGRIQSFEVGTFRGLQQIHAYLFQDVFPFAGELRTVNLAKGNFRFAPVLFLESNLSIIDTMPMDSFDEIIAKYVEMNVAHPFREGNGRSMRLWLDQMLLKALGQCVDWARVDKDDYLLAMERSPVNALELRVLLEGALIDDGNSRDVYLRGVQQSYYYEDMDAYTMDEIERG